MVANIILLTFFLLYEGFDTMTLAVLTAGTVFMFAAVIIGH
jgi:hypothetical protein